METVISAELDALPPLLNELSELMEPHSSEENRGDLLLAVQELCVNIIVHGYAGVPGDMLVKASCSADDFTMVVEDQAGTPFTLPEAFAMPDPETLPEGGWGLYLIRSAVDVFEHTPLSPGNIWHLHKSWSK